MPRLVWLVQHTTTPKGYNMATRTANWSAGELIRNLEPFQGSNFRGAQDYRPWDTGRMSRADRWYFRNEDRDVVYVVYSYATPIAWALDNGDWVVTDTGYSVSTDKHQGIVRRSVSA